MQLCMRLFVFLCMKRLAHSVRNLLSFLFCVSVFLFSPVCVCLLVFGLIAIESSGLKIVCPDQIYCKWGRAPPRAPGILSPCIVLYFIKCVFCSVSGGEGDWLCNVRAHICHKYHKLNLWRKNCHVEKFWDILGNFGKF